MSKLEVLKKMQDPLLISLIRDVEAVTGISSVYIYGHTSSIDMQVEDPVIGAEVTYAKFSFLYLSETGSIPEYRAVFKLNTERINLQISGGISREQAIHFDEKTVKRLENKQEALDRTLSYGV